MAKIYKNDRNHLVIQMNAEEATNIGFGIEVTGLLNVCVCGTCNTECKHEHIYYVAGINEIQCKNCITDYVKNMNHYIDDDSLKYEVRHFNFYAEKLGMKTRVKVNADSKFEFYEVEK